jgi:hypothetical protein
MRKRVKRLINDLSSLDGEELQVAVRLAHNNLQLQRESFDQFVSEAAAARILQYSYLHLLFAQIIVSELSDESDRRYGRANELPQP